METTRAAAHRRVLIAVAALFVAAAHPAAAVTILATSATVSNPGDRGQICVFLQSGGQQVAGTQNDLRWDNNCASMPVGAGNKPACQVAGSHGKDLHTDFPPGPDFSVRGLILSFGDVDPMPDGPLYCCNFESEADPGQCCTINITNVGSSDPHGNALSTSAGPPARICTMSSSGGQGIGSIDSGMNQPLSASNAPAGGGTNLPPANAPPAAAAPAGGGGPINQVLPGGGARVENPTPFVAAPGAPMVPPTAPAAPQVAQAKPPAAAAAPAAPVAPPAATAAATPPPAAPTTPAPADTPTAKIVVRPTARPTKAASAAQQQIPRAAANAPQNSAPNEAQGGGWFGCEVVAGASPAPLLGLGALAGLGVTWQRWRRRRVGSRPQR